MKRVRENQESLLSQYNDLKLLPCQMSGCLGGGAWTGWAGVSFCDSRRWQVGSISICLSVAALTMVLAGSSLTYISGVAGTLNNHPTNRYDWELDKGGPVILTCGVAQRALRPWAMRVDGQGNEG